MLKRLLIKNLVLVESCEIEFRPGFSVITGETGAGKSIILSSLGLLLGERADTSLIRQGANLAIIEATFVRPNICPLLEQEGIQIDGDGEIVIRRELLQSGKSRAFISDQAVSIGLLKQLSHSLLEISSQHAHTELLAHNAPLELLDRFADTDVEKQAFQIAYSRVVELQKSIREHAQIQSKNERQIQTATREVEEIDKAKVTPGEDEELFGQFSKLAMQAEVSELTGEILAHLEGDDQALAQLSRQKRAIEQLAAKDTKYSLLASTYKELMSQLKDIVYELTSAHIEGRQAQESYEEIDARLKLLHDLKRKYGPTLENVLEWREKQLELMKTLSSQMVPIESLEEELQEAERAANRAAELLSKKRKNAHTKLSKQITGELHELNMPQAQFDIDIQPASRTSLGDDAVRFLLTPNRGEAAVAIQEGISGGELARVQLAIKSVLIDKSHVGTILFDEIDANIGGQTASIVGKKLQRLGTSCQVLVITHFAQVALCADTHFRIHKSEVDERTTSHIQRLETPSEIEAEIVRMQGGHSPTLALIA